MKAIYSYGSASGCVLDGVFPYHVCHLHCGHSLYSNGISHIVRDISHLHDAEMNILGLWRIKMTKYILPPRLDPTIIFNKKFKHEEDSTKESNRLKLRRTEG